MIAIDDAHHLGLGTEVEQQTKPKIRGAKVVEKLKAMPRSRN
jgi:hypothetical protein